MCEPVRLFIRIFVGISEDIIMDEKAKCKTALEKKYSEKCATFFYWYHSHERDHIKIQIWGKKWKSRTNFVYKILFPSCISQSIFVYCIKKGGEIHFFVKLLIDFSIPSESVSLTVIFCIFSYLSMKISWGRWSDKKKEKNCNVKLISVRLQSQSRI